MDLLSLINNLIEYGLQHYSKTGREAEIFGEDWFCYIKENYILFKCLADGGEFIFEIDLKRKSYKVGFESNKLRNKNLNNIEEILRICKENCSYQSYEALSKIIHYVRACPVR